jgi:hypothetical protein
MIILSEYRKLLEETKKQYDDLRYNIPIQKPEELSSEEKEYNAMLAYIDTLTIRQCKIVLKEIEKAYANLTIYKERCNASDQKQGETTLPIKGHCKICGKEIRNGKLCCDKCLKRRREKYFEQNNSIIQGEKNINIKDFI